MSIRAFLEHDKYTRSCRAGKKFRIIGRVRRDQHRRTHHPYGLLYSFHTTVLLVQKTPAQLAKPNESPGASQTPPETNVGKRTRCFCVLRLFFSSISTSANVRRVSLIDIVGGREGASNEAGCLKKEESPTHNEDIRAACEKKLQLSPAETLSELPEGCPCGTKVSGCLWEERCARTL